MDTTQWPQGIGVPKPMEISNSGPMIERKPRPQKEQALNCPRCNSTNTKFCYYNNYSLTQPRYFCKTCRRYWTEGGSLRNVPVGGGSRKNKRSSSTSSPSPSSSSKKVVVPHDLTPPPSFSQNPKIHQGQDLNLAYPPTSDYSNISNFVHLPYNDTKSHHQNPNSSSNSRGLSSFMPMPVTDTNTMYPSGFAMQEFKPTLNFTLDGFESGYGGLQGVQETSARLFFPFEDLKNVSNTCDLEENRGQGESNGCWNGMLGGGSW